VYAGACDAGVGGAIVDIVVAPATDVDAGREDDVVDDAQPLVRRLGVHERLRRAIDQPMGPLEVVNGNSSAIIERWNTGVRDRMHALWQRHPVTLSLAGATGLFAELKRRVTLARMDKIAAAATTLRLVAFDNSKNGGGHAQPDAASTAWVGGTLVVDVQWSGSALEMYPDVKSARLFVEAIDEDGKAPTLLATADLTMVEWPGMILHERLDTKTLAVDGPVAGGMPAGTLHVVLGNQQGDVSLVTASSMDPPGITWRLFRVNL